MSATLHRTRRVLMNAEAFIDRIAPDSLFFPLFDCIHEVCFFVKDRKGRILVCNQELLNRFGFGNKKELIGKTDFDLHPRSMAEKYRADDEAVARTGKPLLRIVELFINSVGVPDWYVTDKMPVLSRSGKVIGVMGIIQRYSSGRAPAILDHGLARILDYIQEYLGEPLDVPQLARMAAFSVRHFERWFKEHMKMTPQQYIIKRRVYQACEELRLSTKPINELAAECGFFDQSALTKVFHQQMGITPKLYRKVYGANPGEAIRAPHLKEHRKGARSEPEGNELAE